MIHKILSLAGIIIFSSSLPLHAQTGKPGNPEKELPPEITQLTGFGERAAWSPEGKRIAFSK